MKVIMSLIQLYDHSGESLQQKLINHLHEGGIYFRTVVLDCSNK